MNRLRDDDGGLVANLPAAIVEPAIANDIGTGRTVDGRSLDIVTTKAIAGDREDFFLRKRDHAALNGH